MELDGEIISYRAKKTLSISGVVPEFSAASEDVRSQEVTDIDFS